MPAGKIIITHQFRGPDNSGNGGYTCGRLASYINGPAEVTLKLPPPLNQALDVVQDPNGGAALMKGEQTIATAVPASIHLTIPDPPSYETALQAAGQHSMMEVHTYPGCFVCGPARKKADGLCIFAGRVENQDYVAAPWIPEQCFADESGVIRDEIVWAALDCPGAWAILARKLRPILLGRMAVEIMKPVKAGQVLVVTGWQIAEEGRKIETGTALYDENSDLCAKGRSIWIELK